MMQGMTENIIDSSKKKYYEYVKQTINKLRELPELIGLDLNLALVGTHPLNALLANNILSTNLNSSDEIYKLIRYISKRYSEDISSLRAGKILSIQSNYLMPQLETRGIEVGAANISEEVLGIKLNQFRKEASERMPLSWNHFIDIVKSYTIVELDGREAPCYFSGSFSQGFGGIHGADIVDLENFIEIFTHEAGHLRLILLDWVGPQLVLNSNDDESFFSPWRSDPRPMMGIYHAHYVFTNVAEALLTYTGDPNHKRILYMLARVEDAGYQIEKFAQLSPSAIQLFHHTKSIFNRLQLLVDKVPYQKIKQDYLVFKESVINSNVNLSYI
jgi:hypothetical protein